MRSRLVILVIFLISSCKLAENYKPGGFGSVNGGPAGGSSSLVTISGRVMSQATFNASSGNFLGLRVRSNYVREAQDEFLLKNQVGPMAGSCSEDDPCNSASWSLQFLGSSTVVSTGTSSCGDFEIPSVPEGKEGVVTFTCAEGKTQRCIVKAGDVGLSCNAVADAVVETVEASLSASLSSSNFNDKTLAKVATAIVETTNSDNTEADELKNAIDTCKNIANSTSRKSCYKSALESSSQSTTLSVVKTLAQTWTVRNLFNFLVGTAHYSVQIDDFIFSTFGSEIANWTSTDFITKTREYITDLVNNPEYVEGDSTKGEQVAKITCDFWYNRGRSGGQGSYKPKMVLNAQGILAPTCKNDDEIALFTGLAKTDPKVVGYLTFLDNNNGGNDSYQMGTSLDACNNSGPPNNDENSFCVGKAEFSVKSRFVEDDRNDPTGENNQWRPENRVSLISVFDNVVAKLNQIEADSNFPLCVQFPANGAPIINFANTNCKNKLQFEMSKLRNDFTGMLGLYNYLNYPERFKTVGTGKLSLQDIHKAYTRRDFANYQMIDIARGDFTGRQMEKIVDGQTKNYHIEPVLDFSGTNPFISNVFQFSANNFSFNNPIDASTYYSLLDNGSLSSKYNYTFKIFEKIPLLSEIQNTIQNASHHKRFNPLGSKYSFVIGRKKPQLPAGGGTDYSAPDYPVFCRVVNKNTNQPMLKDLNPDTKIDCIADPTDTAVVNPATSIDPQDSAKFNNMPSGYPFVLQERGYNGDNFGRVFALADRRTGMTIRIAEKEVYIVEARSTNNSTFVVDGSCTIANNTGVVKVKMSYGFGSNTRFDIQTAYCLNMSGFINSDDDTRIYFGGDIKVSKVENGYTNSYFYQLVGGRDTASSSFVLRPMCWFAAAKYFEIDSSNIYGGARYKASSLYPVASASISLYTDTWGSFYQIVAPQGSDVVDYCDNASSYSGKTKYHLTMFWDNQFYNANIALQRNSKPIGIFSESENTDFRGVVTTIGDIEGNLAPSIIASTKIANTSGVTYANHVKLLNQKHNDKFDPFCDDLNGDGKCNCKDSSGTLVTNRECNLSDVIIEPTLSNPPFWPGDPNAAKFTEFYERYGGLGGNDTNGPYSLDDIDQNYFNTNGIYLDYQNAVFCKFKESGKTFPGRPTFIHYQSKLNNLHFPGCPSSEGGTVTPVGYDGSNNPISGGGPIRIIRPGGMFNAYDVSRPKKLMTMIQYATKSVGQGVTIDSTKKIFTFDEALALIQVRNELPPRDFKPRAGSSSGPIYRGASLTFSQQYIGGGDNDILSALLRAILRPSDLTAPEPTSEQLAAQEH